MCYCATSEREREAKQFPLLYRFSKVIVIFAYVPQKSQMSFCANELRAFFFLAQKYEHPKQCNTPDAVFLRRRPNFLSLCRFESSHVFVETHLEREREREQKKRFKASTS